MEKKQRVLIVEDEKNIVDILRFNLRKEGYDTQEAYDGEVGLALALQEAPDLILLDLMLPKIDGFGVCEVIRRSSQVPVVMLTALDGEAQQLRGFGLNIDDYVTKPFSSAELLARIRSALRTFGPQEGRKPGAKFVLGDLRIDYEARRVCIRSQDVRLTQTEYNIVAFLSEHCGNMMTYSAIAKGVWGYFDEGCVKRLQVNMANIRRKFGVRLGENRYIANELGVGYRMNGERDE